MSIIVKTEKEIEAMRRGGQELARIMGEIEKKIVPGENTHEIDKLARELVFEIEGIAVFEGYGDRDNPYPGAVCTSINSEIVHGIPSKDRVLKSGDIVKIDIGMKYEGMITDMSRTFPCGKIAPNAYKLLKVTKESLEQGISKIKAGAKLSEYSIAVDGYVRSHGFSAVRELVGHGVGRELHEDPQIPNFKSNEKDIILKEGMTLALEPMINEGTRYIKLMEDGWTYVTKDGKLSAHFEDTVVVTRNGCEILTR
ncbi:MAG TPA: type I methionyl aminopeptidase [Candidatus Moranbacteria bacterium]|nr:type I methionyl aminopeptidase [Candidatus Moranbacteria bacterium]